MAWQSRKAPTSTAPAAAPAPAHPVPPPTAGLPPVAAPPPAAPPAAVAAPAPAPAQPAPAPAAAAPAPARRRRAAPDPAAAAAQPAPAPAAAPVVQATATVIPTTPAPSAGFLSLFAPQAVNIGLGLKAWQDAAAPIGEPNVFPVVELTGGDNGGALDKDEMNVEGEGDDLPIGRDPVYGIVLGFRLITLVWPKQYERGEKQTPKWKAVVNAGDAGAIDVLCRALSRCNFTPKDKRTIFSAPELGIVSAGVEILTYEEQAGLMVMRSGRTYGSVNGTYVSLVSAFPNGQLQPTPMQLTPTTTAVTGKDYTEHHIDCRQLICEQTQAAANAFQAFVNENGQDPELTAALSKWQTGTLTADQMENLGRIAETRY